MVAPNYEASLKFLQRWRPGGPWVLTAISLDKKSIETRTFREERPVLEWLERHGTDRNIYFSVNPTRYDVSKKPKRADVKELAWLHCDIDPRAGEDLDQERQRALRLLLDPPNGLPFPTAIVFSGGGYQGFWKLKEPFAINGEEALYEKAKRYNQSLELVFGADNCSNVDRVMRLPGTINRPDAQKRKKGRTETLAELVEWRDNYVYPLGDFTPAPAVQKSEGSANVDKACVRPLTHEEVMALPVSDLCKVVIGQGHDPDNPDRFPSRSEAVHYVCCECVRSGVDDQTIFSIVMDPGWPISGHVLDQKGSPGYAIRQIKRAHEVKVPAGAILVAEGRLNEILDEAEAAMLPGTVYEYGALGLVRPYHLEAPTSGDIRREQGTMQLATVDPLWLVQEWARSGVMWCKKNAKGQPTIIDPPTKYANHYIARTGSRNVPALTGVITAPTLRPDGSLLDTPGYDATTGLIYDPGGVAFPPIPDNPTEHQARDAMLRLRQPLRAMPWVSNVDESVALAAVLTGLIRRTLPTAPIFLFDAPAAGSGKTLIAEVAGVVATGHRPAAMSVGGDAVELEKRLSSALLAGDAVILLDNLSAPLPSCDMLCSMASSSAVASRVLGRNEKPTLPCAVLLLVTGNNVAVNGDLYRRAVKCRIDSGKERPEQRQFDFHPVTETQRDRVELVVAGLTALRWASQQANRDSVRRLGSYEAWNLVQNTLVWLGWADPVVTQEEIRSLDNDTATLARLLHEWHRTFPDRHEVTVGDLWEMGVGDESFQLAMLECVSHRNGWSAKSFGRYLNKNKDRIVDGLQLRRGPVRCKQATWEVIDTAAPTQEVMAWAS